LNPNKVFGAHKITLKHLKIRFLALGKIGKSPKKSGKFSRRIKRRLNTFLKLSQPKTQNSSNKQASHQLKLA
jgi:hypothetical protein